MNNYQKYFGSPELAAKTLECIANGTLTICDGMCSLVKSDCEEGLMDDYNCCSAINHWLKQEATENE